MKLPDTEKDGEYDCLVPGSGGKDSVYASYLLKQIRNEPLTVVWPPIMYTDYGYKIIKITKYWWL